MGPLADMRGRHSAPARTIPRPTRLGRRRFLAKRVVHCHFQVIVIHCDGVGKIDTGAQHKLPRPAMCRRGFLSGPTMVKETKFLRKQADKAERIAQAVTDVEISTIHEHDSGPIAVRPTF
jgi:hypothetical protein